MAIPISSAMRQRMRSPHKGKQPMELAGNVITSDYKPSAEVFLTRGAMRRHYHPPFRITNTPEMRRQGTNRWRGDWDEKYRFLGQFGEEGAFHIVPDTHPPRRVTGGGGKQMPTTQQGPIGMPYLKQITVRNGLDQNGIGTSTVTLQNAEWQEVPDDEMLIYHLLREGFFSPYYGGENFGTEMSDNERFGVDRHGVDLGGAAYPGAIFNSAGKQISGLILPNRHIDIYQGYGNELQRSFTGLVNSVEISSNPRQITLNCTDFGRVLTDTAFIKQTVPPGNWPVAFGDKDYWNARGKRKEWPKHGAPRNMVTVSDLSNVVGHILGWAGFQYFKAPLLGRIGGMGTSPTSNLPAKNNAVFEGESFGMGSYFIDGINRIKELLGYHFYITPEFWSQRPGSERFRDPASYDGEESPYSIGLPYFVPPNIWVKEPTVEQYLDDEILLNANLTYDIEAIRNSIYVFNTGLDIPRAGGGTTQTIGMHARHGLAAGMPRVIFYNLREAMGNVTLTPREVEIFILMTFIQTLMYFVKGTITVAGHPGAKINDQCDILERHSGTWRRFFIWGFESTMQLGPSASYRTTFQVSNMDNVHIRRYKAAITARTPDWRKFIGRQGSIRETSSPK